MSSLQFIWNRYHTYELKSKRRQPNRKVEVIERLSAHVHLANLDIYDVPCTHVIAVKIAHGEKELEKMATEAEFYDNELASLQGCVVPRMFGFFKGDIDGVYSGCLLLEYCSGSAPRDLHEWYRKIMLSACMLHQAGVVHGDLVDGRHFIRMEKEDVRIIDFSNASYHECRQGTPYLWLDGHATKGCRELIALENAYGVYSGNVYK